MVERYDELREVTLGWKQAGVPLVGYFNDRWEAVPCGDDTGLFYIVPFIARHTGWDVARSLRIFQFGLIAISALCGLLGLWVTFIGIAQRILAVIPVAAASYAAHKLGDVYVVQAAVVVMLIPWITYALKTGVKQWHRFSILFLAGNMLGLAQWIRMQSGLSVILFIATTLCLCHLRKSSKVLLFFYLIAGMSLPLLFAEGQLRERDRFLAIHLSDTHRAVNHHLFWHTAYLGLAYLSNPYVPAWRDLVAVEYVETIDPSAIYGGEKYEGILRSRVENIVRQHPQFVCYTIAAKVGVLGCMLLLCVNIGFPAAIWYPKPLSTEVSFWLAISLGALPGILAIPVPAYVLGMITFGLYYWYYSLTVVIGHYFGPDTAW